MITRYTWGGAKYSWSTFIAYQSFLTSSNFVIWTVSQIGGEPYVLEPIVPYPYWLYPLANIAVRSAVL